MDTTRNQLSKSPSSILSVFLVEDSPEVRQLVVSDLSEIPGIALTGFSDTENDALEQLLLQPCDVLIVDIELRHGNGMSLLRKLSETGAQTENLKIIFSNNICDAYRRAGQRYGAHHFFDKSFELPKLRELLEQLGAHALQA